MSDKSRDHEQNQVAVTLPGTVKKVIPPFHPSMPEKAEVPCKVPMSYIERFESKIL